MTASAPVPSPCINVCRMHDATGWCEGCQRTLAEIGAWSSMDDAGKLEVWRQLEQRRDTLAPTVLGTRQDVE
jgi:uncharacterized protein